MFGFRIYLRHAPWSGAGAYIAESTCLRRGYGQARGEALRRKVLRAW